MKRKKIKTKKRFKNKSIFTFAKPEKKAEIIIGKKYIQTVGESKGNVVKLLGYYGLGEQLHVLSIKHNFPYLVQRRNFERYYELYDGKKKRKKIQGRKIRRRISSK